MIRAATEIAIFRGFLYNIYTNTSALLKPYFVIDEGRVMANRIIRGYWDCSSCGRKGIDGLLDACPGCGAGKDKNVRYYMKSASDVVSEEELAHAGIGRDENDGKHKEWICSYCGYLNNYSNTSCEKCGAPKEDMAQEYGETPPDPQQGTASEADQDAAHQMPSKPDGDTPRGGFLKKRGLLAAAFVLVMLFLFFPIRHTRSITGFSWERAVSLETLEDVDYSGWTLPSGADLRYTKKEFYQNNMVLDHYETNYVTRSRQVLDHYETRVEYEDNGNGTFSEHTYQEPVYTTEYYEEPVREPIYVAVPEYRTKYYYTVQEWVARDTLETSGQDHDPYWDEAYALRDNQRDTSRQEHYYTYFSDGSRIEEDYETWSARQEGEQQTYSKSLAGIEYS